ncbi:hypothetical protein EVAR_99468_1 [Eumeta japonica]|uniref:Uncharacterized protein n=1 Tax=Eumeta variegata TaxID=151549 RepID=A0A4C1Z299_EUMVA|nr:hypothetical protein EVAR_99468_1 [Eumeta japonica]
MFTAQPPGRYVLNILDLRKMRVRLKFFDLKNMMLIPDECDKNNKQEILIDQSDLHLKPPTPALYRLKTAKTRKIGSHSRSNTAPSTSKETLDHRTTTSGMLVAYLFCQIKLDSDITDEEMETDEDDSDIRSEDFSDAFDED